MSHDTDPTPLPPDPTGSSPQPHPELPPPPPGDEVPFELAALSDLELAPLSDPSMPVPDPDDGGGGVSFDLPDVPVAEEHYGERTMGVRLEDLAGLPGFEGLTHREEYAAPEVQPLLNLEQVSPEAEVLSPVGELLPPVEPPDTGEYIPYAEEPDVEAELMADEVPFDLADVPAAEPASGPVATPADVPFLVDDPDAALGNLEPLAPVAPASGWYDPPSVDAGVPTVDANLPPGRAREQVDDLAARIDAQPAGPADHFDGSDIFAGGHVPQAAAADQSDVISATAYAPAEPASDPVSPRGNRPSDVALAFDEPPGGSTIQDPAAADDLPVADEVGDGSGLLVPDAEPFDSARLAHMPNLLTDRHEEADLGSTPFAGHDASSILSELDPNAGEAIDPDSSSIRIEAPGMDKTLTDEFGPVMGEVDFDLTEVDQPLAGEVSGPVEGEPTDWHAQSGSDLFAQGRTAPELYLPEDGGSGRIDPFEDEPILDQPSLSSAPSSIFSGGKAPGASNGSGSNSDVPITDVNAADLEPGDAVEFSDHPDPEMADSSVFHSALPAMEPEPVDEGVIDWGSEDVTMEAGGASGPMSGILSRGPNPEEPSEDLPVPGVYAGSGTAKPAKKPAAKDGSDGSVVVDWVAESGEKANLPKGKTKPRPALDAEPARPKAAPAPTSGRAFAGLALGLLIGVGGSAGVYFSGMLPNGDGNKVAVNPTPPNGGGSMTGTPPVTGGPAAPPTYADARAALEAGDPARALKAIDAAGANTTEAKAARGEARFFTRIRELSQTGAGAAADDAKLADARADLKAAADDADAAKTPEGEKAAVRATLHLGLTHELAGDRAEATKLYEDAKQKFPKSADVFQAALDRLAATAPAGKSSRLTPGEARQLALAVVVLLANPVPPEPPAAAEEAPPEAGPLFWKAVNAAAAGKYADAIEHVAKAKAAHEKRAKALAGRGLNPLSDPLEQIFPRTCDDLKAYWDLKRAIYEHPGVGAIARKDGVEKALDQLAGAEKRAADAMKLAADLKTVSEKAVTDLKAANEKVLTAEKAVVALEKDLKGEKEKVTTLDKDVKDAKAATLEVTDKLKLAEKKRDDADAALAGIAKELQNAKLLPEKYDAPAVIAATRSAASRATGPDLTRLIPPGLSAVAGTGLTTAHLIDLADRVNKFDAAAKAAEAKYATAVADFKKDADKLKADHADDLKKLTAAQADELKKLKDANVVALDKLKDTHTADLRKQADGYDVKVKLLETAVAFERERTAAAVAKAKSDLANAFTPSQALDVWLPLLTSLRRTADADPALAAADKVLKIAPADSEDAAKALTVAGLARLLKGDAAGAKLLLSAATASPAYKRAGKSDWAKAADAGLASIDDPAAPFRKPVAFPGKDAAAAARFLDAGITAYKAGRYAEAERSLAEAAFHDETDPLAWYFLGAARWAGGSVEKARADFAQGGEREKARAVPARVIDAAIAPIQGTARDALNRARP